MHSPRVVGQLLRWGLMLQSLAACSAVPEPDRAAPRHFEGRGFSATLRRDVLHNVSTPQPGVSLYDFHIGSLPLLFMYVGDDAGYPHFGWDADAEQEQVLASGLRAHCRDAKSKSGRARECLIALSQHSPTQLLVFYEQLPPQWAGVADHIIDSIAPAGSGR